MREYYDRGRHLWFEADEVERMMESELCKAGLMPTAHAPAVDVETFISRHLKVALDQYAENLEPSVLGLTEFSSDGHCRILINQKLSEEIDREEECPPGIRGRWRATMAHEVSHVLMHRSLFLADPRQQSLFNAPSARQPQALLRCLKRDVSHIPRAHSSSSPEEVQANMGMAALLMPRSLFRTLATEAIRKAGFPSGRLPADLARAQKIIVSGLARSFEVSQQAAAIRLQTLGLLSKEEELRLP